MRGYLLPPPEPKMNEVELLPMARVVLCDYCWMHGVIADHDIENCDEDYGDRWGD